MATTIHRSRHTTPTTSPTNDGQEAQKGSGEKKDVPCKFFGRTFRGCARASKCPFLHSWDGLEKEPSRCLACGGKHTAKDCPNEKGGSPTSTTAPRTPPATRAGTDTSTSSTTTTETVRIDDKPQVEGSGGETPASAATTNELKEVLADVGKMPKAMTAVTTIKRTEVKDDPLWARIKALSAKLGCDDEEGAGGLL